MKVPRGAGPAARVLALAAVFSTGFGLTLLVSRPAPVPSPAISMPLLREGTELALVLLVSPSCAASNHPGLPSAWVRLADAVGDGATEVDAVRRIGIALSGRPDGGIRFLERCGDLDEVGVGGGARNHGALRYMLVDFPGPAVLPQIVLVERVYSHREFGGIEPSSEVVLRRWTGVQAILDAADRVAGSQSTIGR